MKRTGIYSKGHRLVSRFCSLENCWLFFSHDSDTTLKRYMYSGTWAFFPLFGEDCLSRFAASWINSLHAYHDFIMNLKKEGTIGVARPSECATLSFSENKNLYIIVAGEWLETSDSETDAPLKKWHSRETLHILVHPVVLTHAPFSQFYATPRFPFRTILFSPPEDKNVKTWRPSIYKGWN